MKIKNSVVNIVKIRPSKLAASLVSDALGLLKLIKKLTVNLATFKAFKTWKNCGNLIFRNFQAADDRILAFNRSCLFSKMKLLFS